MYLDRSEIEEIGIICRYKSKTKKSYQKNEKEV